MIEVVTFTPGGDRVDSAEAESPEAAVTAARALLDDFRDAHPYNRLTPTASFYVDGKAVRSGLGRGDLR